MSSEVLSQRAVVLAKRSERTKYQRRTITSAGQIGENCRPGQGRFRKRREPANAPFWMTFDYASLNAGAASVRIFRAYCSRLRHTISRKQLRDAMNARLRKTCSFHLAFAEFENEDHIMRSTTFTAIRSALIPISALLLATALSGCVAYPGYSSGPYSYGALNGAYAGYPYGRGAEYPQPIDDGR